jgi:DNA helicase HerA-like ATPase
MSNDGLFLGGTIDPATGKRSGDTTHYDRGDLTTHGVIVGMTGSGKTGLGIVYLEEVLLSGVPTLILDPKGDMTNLLLTFPDLQPENFAPWIDAGEARRDGKTVDEAAVGVADLWRNGLASWGQDGERIRRLRDSAEFTVYTPGSTAGVPLNIVGSLSAPDVAFDDEAEALRDEIEGFVSGLLGLVGIEADPISSREHILLANLIEHSWRAGRDLDLASLLGQIQQPPLRKLGVFDVDTFFPEKDRLALAMKLNGLIASPAFASWLEGPDLDVAKLLYDGSGAPRSSILYLAHLSDEERQFIVTLILSKVVTWMRTQSGVSDLRALIYMDEVYGFVPPTAQPPSKKPILTILKQGRAFGVGMLLSTQNPVDLDYKAMSNAGTWCVGRLQTERDKARIVEALQSARGDADSSLLDDTISGLDKRQFLLHNTREPVPEVFTTRWALSYLRGPLTKEQIEQLMEGTPARRETARESATAAASPVAASSPLADNESPIAPKVADRVPVYFMDPGAPWAAEVGAKPGATRYRAAITARVHLLFDDSSAKLKHTEEWEAIYLPISEPFDESSPIAVDYDDRDFRREPPLGAKSASAVFVLPDAPIHTTAYFKSVTSAIKDHLYRNRAIKIYKNSSLEAYSRTNETPEEFAARCDRFAEERADAEVARLRDSLEGKMRRLRTQIDNAARRTEELEVDVRSRRQQEIFDGVGSLLGGLLGGRRSTRGLSRASSRRGQTRRTEQRLATAKGKVSDKTDALEELEREALLAVEEINDAWESKAADIEAVEIGLEKTDIDVDEIAVLWVPTG